MYVYFVRSGVKKGAIKIGVAKNVLERELNLAPEPDVRRIMRVFRILRFLKAWLPRPAAVGRGSRCSSRRPDMMRMYEHADSHAVQCMRVLIGMYGRK